jgi:hypothetical protein
MTYLAGFDYDIFVSYAHVDNIAIEPADHGWVDALVRILGDALRVRLESLWQRATALISLMILAHRSGHAAARRRHISLTLAM